MTLKLRLFEHLQVADNAVAITPLLRPRAQRLLAYLLLHRHTSLTRERIAFTLWPDSPEQAALGTLRRALSDLRTALPAPQAGPWINAAHGELCWNSEASYWLDVEAFEHLIRQATPAALHDAVALYTGDLLVEWDNEWILVERERLRQLQLNALRQLVAHHRALGKYTTALDLARQALALDPLSETIHRDLIALHYEAGDRAAALAAYERLRTLLHDELGVEPMIETEELRAAIVRGASLPRPEISGAGPVLDTPAVRALPKLTGREAEIAQFSTLWESAAAGHGRFAIVSGEAGVGKTHLVLSLADHVTRRGGLVLLGHCYEFEHALPYQALIEMLRSAANVLRHADLPPIHRAVLSRLAPDVLYVADSPAAEAETASADSRTYLFEALWQAFLALARNQPLLLLFEDGHWAAESTLDWLTYIAPRIAASRLLVAITYRTHEVGAKHAVARLRRRFAREGAVSVLSLMPLSRESHRELVAHLSGLEPQHAVQVADRFFIETDGNPFFLHELVRGLIEAGQINIEGGRWLGPFVDASAAAEVPLPESLRATITARVERLTEMTRAFLQVAAVAGRVFQYEIVQRAGAWADELALGALEHLLAHGFIHPSKAEGEFAFAHHLVREVIYADLTPPRRIYWHRRVANTLVQSVAHLSLIEQQAMAGHIVHHARAGKLWALVFQWAPLAAEHAYGLHAYADALSALEAASKALDQLRCDPDFDLTAAERQQIDVLLTRAALIPFVGRPLEEHGQVLQTAADLLARYPDQRLQAMYDLRQADYLSSLSEYERAIEAALNAYARFRELDDQHGAAQSLYAAGGYKITISQNTAGRRLFQQALALYRAIDDSAGEALCLSGLAWAELNLGAVADALRHLSRALELSEQRSDKLAMARTCYTLAAAWDFYHNPARVQDFAERSLHLYREIGFALTAYRPMLFIAEVHRLRGELAYAQTVYQQVCVAAQASSDSWLEGWASQMLGRLALSRADLQEAEQRLLHAYRLRQHSGEIQNQISDLTWLGRLRLAQAQPTAALEYTSRAIEQLESLWGEFYVWEMPDVFFGHAQALAVTGNAAGAKAFLQRAYDTLMHFAAQIVEPSTKQIFLAYPINARLVAAWERGWPLADLSHQPLTA